MLKKNYFTFSGCNVHGDLAKLRVYIEAEVNEPNDDVEDIITARGNTAVGLLVTHRFSTLQFQDAYTDKDLKQMFDAVENLPFTIITLKVVETKLVIGEEH